MTSTKAKSLNRLDKFARSVRIGGMDFGASEEVLERDVNIVGASAIGGVSSNERGVHVLDDERDDLAIETIYTTLFSKRDMIGSHDVTEPSSLTVEGVSEFADVTHFTAHTLFATLISGFVAQKTFEAISNNSCWTQR